MSVRVLLVDDEVPILDALATYLAGRGYDVDCAAEAEEAEALLVNNHYDAVVSDLRLTPFDRGKGLEILELVRTRKPSTRIVVLTGQTRSDLIDEAQRLGVDAVLHKPLPLSQLATTLSSLLGDAVVAGEGQAVAGGRP